METGAVFAKDKGTQTGFTGIGEFMTTEEYDYRESELKKLAEQLHEYKERKQELELELSSAEFHQEYIPERKESARIEVGTYILCILVLTFFCILAIVYLVYYFAHFSVLTGELFAGMLLLGQVLYLPFGCFGDYMLVKHMIEISKEESIQLDGDNNQERIQLLEEEVSFIEEQIAELSKSQELLSKEREELENI